MKTRMREIWPFTIRFRENAFLLAGVVSVFAMAFSVPARADETLIASVVEASSILDGGNYGTWNLQDYNSNTAWVEGVPGNGEGEFLIMEIAPGTTITGGVIFTGYQKSEDLFFKNSAPSELSFSTGSETRILDLGGEVNRYYGSEGAGYSFRFDKPLVSDGSVVVTIRMVRPGWLYEDTCISELRLTGRYATEDSFTADPDILSLTNSQKGRLSSLANQVCQIYTGYDQIYDMEVHAADLEGWQQAFLLYWYQYNVSDNRIDHSGEYNTAGYWDMTDILKELFDNETDPEAMSVFQSRYVEYQDGDTLYMNGTGDFGDAGSYYFAQPDSIWTEDNRIALSGRVMEWNSNAQSYIHTYNYTAYYTSIPKTTPEEEAKFCFDMVVVE